MTTDTHAAPFGKQAPAEVHLPDAPLARVLVQARFESMGAFLRPNVVAPLVDDLLDLFPLYDEGHEMQLIVGPNGVSQQDAANKIWRLRSSDGAEIVSVSNGSIAFETSRYGSRTEFIAAFARILDSFNTSIGKSLCNRIGIRYTNRASLAEIEPQKIRQMLNPDVHGGLAVPETDDASLQHSIADILFSIGGDAVQARIGVLPSGAVYDPTLPPIDASSWFLDLDSYSEVARPLTAQDIEPTLNVLAERAYSMFRWAVNDSFLRHFGGTP